MTFEASIDIANRALDHLGASHIANINEESINNDKITFIYDKVRRAELRRNTWRFSIRRVIMRPIDVTTYLLAPQQWNPGIQYLPGSIVSDGNGQLWISNAANNINNDPNVTREIWEGYFGQLTVDAFDTTGTTVYFSGDLVYVAGANSTFVIYMSLQNNNTETPNVADTWNATTTYQQDETVAFGGHQWRSQIPLNLNNSPATGPGLWLPAWTYTTGNQVTGKDGFIYTSVGSGNVNNDPVLDGGANWTNTNVPNAWTASPLIPVSSSTWVSIYAGLNSLNIVYPLNTGPLSQAFSRNIFRLPAGYLRQVVNDPKAGVNPFLGAAIGRQQNDWEFEGNYVLTQQSTPIMLRFVADLQRVSDMDDMFCEGFAARIGMEGCESITGSTAKYTKCENEYKRVMGEARIVNAVEIGPIQPPLDDYLTCRI